jgi:aspartate/methionine/tyrosine aminotransferase
MGTWISSWENRVEYNLSASGVRALRLGELLTDDHDLMNELLDYGQTNGSEELRERIAALYSGADVDNVLVTNGSAEANFLAAWCFLGAKTEIAVMLPNYPQIPGLAKTFRGNVKSFRLREVGGEWKLDMAALRRAVGKRTKLIAVCNPNNPTGAVLQEKIMDEICDIAGRVGAWILSDELYQGSELDGRTTPSFWGRYEKVIVVNGLSKTYGFPGLRLGWIVTTKQLADRLWSYHEYATISSSVLSDYLARRILEPEIRSKILSRTRGILQANLPIMKQWVERNADKFSFVPPLAGANALVKHNLSISSVDFANRLLRQKSTLIVPGYYFGLDRYLRIGYAASQDYLKEGLRRIEQIAAETSRQ